MRSSCPLWFCFPFAYKLLNRTHHPIEFVDEIGVIAMLAERGYKRAVIPNGPILFPGKPLENLETISSKLSQDRAGVMQLIGR